MHREGTSDLASGRLSVGSPAVHAHPIGALQPTRSNPDTSGTTEEARSGPRRCYEHPWIDPRPDLPPDPSRGTER